MREGARTIAGTFSSKAQRPPDLRQAAVLSPSGAAWLAWFMCSLSLAFAALGLFLLVLSREALPGVPIFEQAVEEIVVAISFSTVGAVLAPRFPSQNYIGWLFCSIGLLAGVLLFCGE
jgi:hypothetical protein